MDDEALDILVGLLEESDTFEPINTSSDLCTGSKYEPFYASFKIKIG